MSLTKYSEVYGVQYPSFVEITKKHEKVHWIEDDASLNTDVEQWKQGKILPEEKRLVENILRLFTQCYSDDTEILTATGWKLISDIDTTHRVAQFDEGEISFVKPTRVVSYDYSGEMYNFKDNLGRCDLLVTPNHKMLFSENGVYKHANAEDVVWYQGKKLHTSGMKKGVFDSITPMDRLRIAFQADGNLKSDVDGSKLGFIPHRFAFSKQRKISRMENLLNECGLNYIKSERIQGGQSYTEFYVELQEKLSKTFSWVDLENVSTNWCCEFIDELSHWDSHVDEWGKITYSNCNFEAVDMVQAIAVMTNRYSTSSEYIDDRSSKFSDIRLLRWQKNNDGLIDGQSIRRGSTVIDYNGKVVCVTVPSGYVIVRRNLSAVVCGNSDVDVGKGYYDKLIPVIKNNEARNMLGSFAAREGIHQRAYALLSDTLGLGDDFYWEFLDYHEMKEKHEFIVEDIGRSHEDFVTYLAKQTLVEGVNLFASFAILLNFDRLGKLPGMCDIVRWSQIDEGIHIEGNVALFREFLDEHPKVVDDVFKKGIYKTARNLVRLEDVFIDKVFTLGGVENLDKEDVKKYVRYVTDYRLNQLGFKSNWHVKENPLPWVDHIQGKNFSNFFERTTVEYSKANLDGSFTDAYQLYGGK